jgi:hypothetical protein
VGRRAAVIRRCISTRAGSLIGSRDGGAWGALGGVCGRSGAARCGRDCAQLGPSDWPDGRPVRRVAVGRMVVTPTSATLWAEVGRTGIFGGRFVPGVSG